MSFRARLTLAYLVLLTLALSGFGIWVYAYVDRNLHQEFYGSVQRQSKQLAKILADDYDAAVADLRARGGGALIKTGTGTLLIQALLNGVNVGTQPGDAVMPPEMVATLLTALVPELPGLHAALHAGPVDSLAHSIP